MDAKAIIIIFSILLITGCTQLEGLYKSCPSSCDDGVACTQDVCSPQTHFECTHAPLDGPQPFCSGTPGTCKIQTCKAGGCVVEDVPDCCGNLLCESRESPSNCARDCQATVDVSCSVADPLVPILVELHDVLHEDFVTCTITNSDDKPVSLRLEASIANMTQAFAQNVDLQPNSIERLAIPLEFSSGALGAKESQKTRLEVTLFSNGQTLGHKLYPLTVSSAQDILWDYKGKNLKFSSAAWVTPRDACVGQLLSNAKELNTERALTGYAGYEELTKAKKAQQTYIQAESIFNAIKGQGVSYLNTPISFDDAAQRVRFPRESLEERAGNCIDASLLFASAFEALGMNSILVFVPGHVFVGVETYPESGEYLFIETTLVGTASFEEARQSADTQFDKAQKNNELEIVQLNEYSGYFSPVPSENACTLGSTCTGGLHVGECSSQKPFQCMGNLLVENPTRCGCNEYEIERNGVCENAVLENETFVLRSGYLHYVGGQDQGNSTLISARYIVHSNKPVEVYVVPTSQDYHNIAQGKNYDQYPSCRGFGILDYDQVCTFEERGGIVIQNERDSDATVTLTIVAQP